MFLILTEEEIERVVKDLRRKGWSSKHPRKNSRQNLAIFRLSCCYGLRRREIMGLRIKDLDWAGTDSRLFVPKIIAKGGKRSRAIWMRWAPGAMDDIREWCCERVEHGAQPNDTLICDLTPGRYGKPLSLTSIARRWRTAIKVLGPQRAKQLTCHKGRHTFCSTALKNGKSLPAVRDAAGHSSVKVTDIYLHAVDDPDAPPAFKV